MGHQHGGLGSEVFGLQRQRPPRVLVLRSSRRQMRPPACPPRGAGIDHARRSCLGRVTELPHSGYPAGHHQRGRRRRPPGGDLPPRRALPPVHQGVLPGAHAGVLPHGERPRHRRRNGAAELCRHVAHIRGSDGAARDVGPPGIECCAGEPSVFAPVRERGGGQGGAARHLPSQPEELRHRQVARANAGEGSRARKAGHRHRPPAQLSACCVPGPLVLIPLGPDDDRQ
mmetsp:Transcript_58376/g.161460  ORF Transcript_58376/g.161460 Transcript_58376/m.161460 type:complete len:228 (-) Transcript_58376:643-1326(-)